MSIVETSNDPNVPAVLGENTLGEGVRGIGHDVHGGVVGINDFLGNPPNQGAGGNGGWFQSAQGEGVRGQADNPSHGGVVGVNTQGGVAVFATSDNGPGVWSTSVNAEAIHGETSSATAAALTVIQLNTAGTGAGIYAESRGNGPAGFFQGNLFVSGDIQLGPGQDCAEDFEITPHELIEPGTVMVLNTTGALGPCSSAYDRKVGGVVSGAGDFRPGIVLGKQECSGNRLPIALIGKVFCKVDAQFGAIEIGDLLTTSTTRGHAMRAGNPAFAFGSVIGKALRPFPKGQGLIPILVALQ